MEKYDIIIIGAGPAGLTAGIYAGRQGTSALILDKDAAGGKSREIAKMENYPGFKEISGSELIDKMNDQMQNTVLEEFNHVETIAKIEEGEYNFKINTIKNTYLSKTLILTTGTIRKQLNVKGEEEFKGRGVSYCATCDGMFFKGKDIIVAGGGNTTLEEALFLNNLGCNVTIIHKKSKLKAEEFLQNKITEKEIKVLLNTKIEEIKGEQIVSSVIIKKDSEVREIPINGIFISEDYKPQNTLVKELNIELDETNHIKTDKNQRTNIEYVYAAGDVCGGLKQWVVACAEGAIAATSAYEDLKI
ncbi:MAG: FAD-dependent oxidoreductase [archaeon]|nr:FAD-dependent oxidoreductase [archaeon]